MRMIFSVLFLMAALVGEPSSQAWAEAPAVHTNRITQQILPLPKGEDMFHFVIFGDRTGGPPEGVKVLAQAVQDTNLLDPDLVMTVGDLIQGYNGQTLWEEQMLEYRGTMRSLRMPWFPVAGNHDIYWRGDGRPPVEHEANYEKHFGPLWYWFEHKQCGFLVLHSDEGDPGNPGKARDYGEPTQQKFSDAQLEWVRKSLAEMKPLRHVFVFMHHQRWATDIYPGSNWTAVHSLLRDNGNVRACFAGHIHRLRYDGVKDGIEYMALATTGGSAPGHYPRLGYLHHFNVVTVRPDGIKVATLPVGAVVDPKMFTPERAADMDLVRSMNPTPVSPPVPSQTRQSITTPRRIHAVQRGLRQRMDHHPRPSTRRGGRRSGENFFVHLRSSAGLTDRCRSGPRLPARDRLPRRRRANHLAAAQVSRPDASRRPTPGNLHHRASGNGAPWRRRLLGSPRGISPFQPTRRSVHPRRMGPSR